MSENNDEIADHNDEDNAAEACDSSVEAAETLECSEENQEASADEMQDEDASEDKSETSENIECSAEEEAEQGESEETEAAESAEETEEESGSLSLEAALDHDALNALTAKILEHFKNNDDLEIDASALEDANTACIQAFIIINRYAKTNNKNLKWLSPSDSFVESFNTLGLYSEMMQMEMA